MRGDSQAAAGGNIAQLRAWARAIKRDVLALYLAARDPRVAWYAKLLALLTAAYALSPIDLIPDFIPVLGMLDDVILVPLAIVLCVRLIPAPLMSELRARAHELLAGRPPTSRVAAASIVVVWIALCVGSFYWLAR